MRSELSSPSGFPRQINHRHFRQSKQDLPEVRLEVKKHAPASVPENEGQLTLLVLRPSY